MQLSADALARLEEHPWPGNVRQLKHVLETSLVLQNGNLLEADDLLLPPQPAKGPAAASARAMGREEDEPDPALFQTGAAPGERSGLVERVAAFERELIARTLRETGGNKARAGRILGLDENRIRYLCRKHGIL